MICKDNLLFGMENLLRSPRQRGTSRTVSGLGCFSLEVHLPLTIHLLRNVNPGQTLPGKPLAVPVSL